MRNRSNQSLNTRSTDFCPASEHNQYRADLCMDFYISTAYEWEIGYLVGRDTLHWFAECTNFHCGIFETTEG